MIGTRKASASFFSSCKLQELGSMMKTMTLMMKCLISFFFFLLFPLSLQRFDSSNLSSSFHFLSEALILEIFLMRRVLVERDKEVSVFSVLFNCFANLLQNFECVCYRLCFTSSSICPLNFDFYRFTFLPPSI